MKVYVIIAIVEGYAHHIVGIYRNKREAEKNVPVEYFCTITEWEVK